MFTWIYNVDNFTVLYQFFQIQNSKTKAMTNNQEFVIHGYFELVDCDGKVEMACVFAGKIIVFRLLLIIIEPDLLIHLHLWILVIYYCISYTFLVIVDVKGSCVHWACD